MAIQDLHFLNAPIAEAIFSIEAAARAPESFAELHSRFREEVPEADFPSQRELMKLGFHFGANERTGQTHAKSESPPGGVAFRDSEQGQEIQFRDGGMSFHRLRPYTSFDEVMPKFQEQWQTFLQVAQPKATSRQSLRFINRITLPPKVEIPDLNDYAQITPAFALDGELVAENLLSRVQLRDPVSNDLALVSFAIANPGQSPLELILDIEVSNERSFAIDEKALWDEFSRLRDLKNRIFSSSLHKKCLELFK